MMLAERTSGGEHLVCLGAVTGAIGVRGEVRIASYAEPPENIAAYGPLIAEPGGDQFVIETTRPVKGGLAARVRGIGDRDSAQGLKGKRLYVSRTALPEPGPEDYYHVDLVGLAVEDEEGMTIGTVTAVHNFGAGDLIEIEIGATGKRAMIPFTRDTVPLVDIVGRRLVATPPGGFIEDDGNGQGETGS